MLHSNKVTYLDFLLNNSSVILCKFIIKFLNETAESTALNKNFTDFGNFCSSK